MKIDKSEIEFTAFDSESHMQECLDLLDSTLPVIHGRLVYFLLRKRDQYKLRKFAQKGHAITVMVEAKVAGFIFYSMKNCGKVLFIEQFHLKDEFRNKGIGREALNFVENLSVDKGCDSLELSVYLSNPAFRLYKRFGFKKKRMNKGFVWWIFDMKKDLKKAL